MTNRFFFDTGGLVAGLVCCLLLMFCLGCKQEEKIVRHRIPKGRSGLEDLRSTAETTTPEIATDRMIVALYEFDDATWFFKITGPIQDVGQSESEWESFLGKLDFADGQPQWELPTGWSVAAEKAMRFATLQIGEFDPPLELAISRLGPDQDLLLNVNRWRKQMGLEPIENAQLDENLRKLDPTKEYPLLFDVMGKSVGGMMAPFANRQLTGRNPPQGNELPPEKKFPSDGVGEVGNETVRFDAPEGWEQGESSSMVPVRLMRTQGDESVQITVVSMPAAVNEWGPNAKRWAGEIGLTELTANELATRTQKIDVDGVEGQLIRLIEEDANRATIAGMVKRGDTAWFLKLTGDKDLVVKNEDLFSTFLDSLGFPANK